MPFVAVNLRHKERADWSAITHIRLHSDAKPDTADAEHVLNHIRRRANSEGIAAIADVEDGFPYRQKRLNPTRGMRSELRHMANARGAGVSEENKGLLEIGADQP